MICRKNINETGFTLIEIIVTIVIVAILGAMIITFLSDSLIHSSDSVKSLKASSNLYMAMANITADYNRYPKWRNGMTYAIGNYVVPTVRNGHYYKCTTAGISGSGEPDWPSSGTKTDGTVTWAETIENGLLLTLNTLQTNINNKNYGTYDVVYNNFVQFTSGVETPGGSKILKVTIKSDQGGTLTALFFSN